jgi:hypothetical protein
MSDGVARILRTIDERHADRPAATRRQLVAGAGAALGTMGLLGWADRAEAQPPDSTRNDAPNEPQTVANVAATLEVLATIVNTVGPEKVGAQLDAITRRNLAASAREELIHQKVLTSDLIGGKPATTRIWVPDRLFASPQTLLTGITVGDTILVNMYLLACTVFARAGDLHGSRFARFAAEFAGVEAVHRALALQSLRGFGNDRAFLKFGQREQAPGLPITGRPGFYVITDAVAAFEGNGIGFGREGATPGAFYDFDEVARRTPDPPDVNTRSLS